MAEDRGFGVRPTDFFEFAMLGCYIDFARPQPTTLDELNAMSTYVALGTIEDIVPPVESCLASIDTHVRYVVNVERVIKGEERTSLQINEFCGHGAKVAGLRHARPTERFLFFLDGPWQLDPDAPNPDEEPAFGFTYHHLGIVRETASGLQFPYPAGRTAADVLADFGSLDEVADAVAMFAEAALP